MSKPLLTIGIPCYNGTPYIDVAINSLINKKIITENVTSLFEIVLVDDGSKDNSSDMALEFAKKWNSIVRKDFIRVIKKENGQYGSVINRAIKEADGIYLKILDVDDTFNADSLVRVLTIIAGFKKHVDIILTDSTFEKVGKNTMKVFTWKKWITPYKIIEHRNFNLPNNLITMHSITYRVEHLRKINYQQIEKVYYSDSQYALIPLSKASSLYYIAIPFYRYYIGRNDQSVNKEVMIRNRKHQLAVAQAIWEQIDFDNIFSKSIFRYVMKTMGMMCAWTTLLALIDENAENNNKEIREFIQFLKKAQPKYSKFLLRSPMMLLMRITHGGHFTKILIILGIKLYGQFKNNILEDWF